MEILVILFWGALTGLGYKANSFMKLKNPYQSGVVDSLVFLAVYGLGFVFLSIFVPHLFDPIFLVVTRGAPGWVAIFPVILFLVIPLAHEKDDEQMEDILKDYFTYHKPQDDLQKKVYEILMVQKKRMAQVKEEDLDSYAAMKKMHLMLGNKKGRSVPVNSKNVDKAFNKRILRWMGMFVGGFIVMIGIIILIILAIR